MGDLLHIQEHHRLIVLLGIDDFIGPDDPGNGNLFLFAAGDSSVSSSAYR